jgi:hypothetical protein
MDPSDFVLVAWSAGHLGGLDVQVTGIQIRFNCEGATFLTPGDYHQPPRQLTGLAWTEVSWVEIIDGETERSRVAATLAFGVAGLATKRSDKFVEMLLHLVDGRVMAFRLFDIRGTELRVQIGPTLTSVGIPTEKPAASNSTSTSLVDELERLAALHSAGALSDEEFAGFKAQLRSAR